MPVKSTCDASFTAGAPRARVHNAMFNAGISAYIYSEHGGNERICDGIWMCSAQLVLRVFASQTLLKAQGYRIEEADDIHGVQELL